MNNNYVGLEKLKRSVSFRGVVVMLVALMSMPFAEAGFVWPKAEQRLSAEPGREIISVAFPFRNAGSKAVRVLSIRPSCDCLNADIAKETWAPGESGEVRVVFTVGGRTGLQDKAVAVTTDDAPDKPVVLRLIVDIPEDVLIRPRALFWALGSKLDEKSVEAVVLDTAKASLDGVQCPDERFHVRAEPTGKPGIFRISVRPASVNARVQSVIRVSFTVAGHPQVYVLYAAVK